MFWCQFLDDTFTHKACFGPLSNSLSTKELGAAPSTDAQKSLPRSAHPFPTQMFVHLVLEESPLYPSVGDQGSKLKSCSHAFLLQLKKCNQTLAFPHKSFAQIYPAESSSSQPSCKQSLFTNLIKVF